MRDESNGFLLMSLNLNGFSGPHAEITLLFFEPLGLNEALFLHLTRDWRGKNEANFSDRFDNPTTIDLKS